MPGAVSRIVRTHHVGVLIFAAALLLVFVTAAPGTIEDTSADRVLGQIDVFHNTVNLGGPSAIMASVYVYIPDPRLSVGGVAIDSTSTVHHLYVADAGNNRVLGWSDVTKLVNGAPADLVIGQSDFYFSKCNDSTSSSDSGGLGADSLCDPAAVAVDSRGNLYVADKFNSRVLEYDQPFAACAGRFPCIGPSANLVFGQGPGGNRFTANDCTVSQTGLCGPGGVALDASDNLYISDSYNSRLLEYDGPFGAGQTNDVTARIVFGQGADGTTFTTNICASRYYSFSGVPGPDPSATGMCAPAGIGLDSNGDLYVADRANARVLEFDGPFGAGRTNDVTADLVFGQGSSGKSFDNGKCGPISQTSLCEPVAVAFDSLGNLFISDFHEDRVLEYDGSFGAGQRNDVTADRVYGQGPTGDSFGPGNPICTKVGPAGLCFPGGAALNGTDLYVFDAENSRVLIFDNALNNFTARLELGQVDLQHNILNFGGPSAMSPGGVSADRNSFPNHLYVADGTRVLGYRDAAGFSNGAAADLVLGQPDFFSGSILDSDPPNATNFYVYGGLALDNTGNLYVADDRSSRVLMFADPFKYQGSRPQAASLVFGKGASGNDFTTGVCDFNKPFGAADLCGPGGVALDLSGNVFIADSATSRVLEYNTPIANPASPNVTANLVFGQGPSGTNFAGKECADGQGSRPSPSDNSICGPLALAVDPSGNLFVVDYGNNRVLEFDGPFGAGQLNDVKADLVFGQGAAGNNFTANTCADGWSGRPTPSATGMCAPQGLSIDDAGNLFVADTSNNRVLEFEGPFGHGKPNDVTAKRVFGQGADGGNLNGSACAGGYYRGAGPLGLCFPTGVDFDAFGDMFVADEENGRVFAYDNRVIGTLKIFPRRLIFGGVEVNRSKSEIITIRNTGGIARKLSPLPISIESVNVSAPFSAKSECPPMLPPGKSCAVVVTFTPPLAMPFAATLTIADNAIGDLQNNVIVRGHGVPPRK
jgi:sugar lactone lactonase YvrE